MPLSKQLLIFISLLFLIVFSINFALSVNNIKSYLEGEAEIHAQNTATALGLNLSAYMLDETDPVIETTMNAVFDRGYYQEIKLVNVDNKPLVTLSNEKVFDEIPSWFINTISMKTAVAESEISSGWNIRGVVSVTLNPGYAYLKLYEQAVSSFYYSLVIYGCSIGLLLLILRVTLSPLKKIDQMALTIASGRFEIIKHLPWTTEVRNVTSSMNMMSRKIEGAINVLNNKLEGIGKTLLEDDLTGLKKKGSFNIEMKQLFMCEVQAYIFIVKIDGLTSLVKVMGNESIDLFLTDFAQILKKIAKQNTAGDIFVYRFFGSEFSLLAKNIDFHQAEHLAELMTQDFTKLAEKYHQKDIAHIGVVPFNPLNSTEGILFAANEAYEQARLIGVNSYYIRQSKDLAKDIAEWKALVFNVIDNQEYKISFVGQVQSFQSEQLLMEEAFTQVLDGNGQAIAIGTFVSIAEKFSKIVDLDKGVVLKVVDYIKTENISHVVAINLSARTIKSSGFRLWLLDLVEKNQAISEQLAFSISSYTVAKEVEIYQEFIEFIHSLHAKVIIKRFETQSMSPDVVKKLKPDFIRLARDIGNGITSNKSKKEFVETMQGIGELLDITILAENIQSEDDLLCIKNIGLAGASR